MRRIQLGERQRLWWPELAGNKLAAVPEFGRRSIRCYGALREKLVGAAGS